MKLKSSETTIRQWIWRGLSALPILAACGGAAFGVSEYGGFFDDGALHVVPPNLIAHDPFLVQGTSQTGALVSNGSALRVLGSGLIDVDENSGGDATGIRVVDTARADVLTGGRINIIEKSNGIAWGLVAEGQATIDFRGVMNISEEGNDGVNVGTVFGSAALNFGGSATVHEEGNGTVAGFRVSEDGHLNISGSLNLFGTGNGDAIPFTATDNASVEYSGNMHVELGTGTQGAIFLDDHANVRLTGGVMTMFTGNIVGSPPKFFSINEDAAVLISGGSLQMIQSGVNRTPYFWMTSQGRLTIVGDHFNYPLGEVLARSGTVNGVLKDGTPFSYQFSREEKALLILVPEPSACWLGFIGLTSCLTTGHRRRACFLRGGSGVPNRLF